MTRPANQVAHGSHQSAPAASLSSGSGGNISAAAIARAIREPVRVCEIDDGDGRTLIVEPLHFHKVFHSKRGAKVCRHHESSEVAFRHVAPAAPHNGVRASPI